MDDLGNDVRRLTDERGDQGSPSWAPDGRHIAFTHHAHDDDGIYIMESDGANWTPLTTHPTGGGTPVWSPTGEQIAFTSSRDLQWEIYVINVDGSGVRNLTQHGARDWYPTWSPDGTQIAFASDRADPDGKSAIYVMDADGDNVRAVAGERWGGTAPTWSPDGREIAYGSAHQATVIQPLLGGPERRLIGSPLHEMHPAWSPNGRQMAYELASADSHNIWVVDIDGQNATSLTNDVHIFNRNPDWFDSSAPRLSTLAVDALGKLLAPWAQMKRP
jgi:Tol biopolymer transport system component